MFCIEKMQITSIYGVHTGTASDGAARFLPVWTRTNRRVCLRPEKMEAGFHGENWRKKYYDGVRDDSRLSCVQDVQIVSGACTERRENIMALEKVLVVDDDPNICDVLRMYLENEGYSVILSYDGEEALVKFNALKPDIILLDVMLPTQDGWQVCREVRKKSSVPIIMITAKGDTFDKVLGLELGADDYVVKPFDAKEVVARIKAIARRVGNTPEESEIKEVRYDKLSVNMTRYELRVDGKVVDTPPKELELLFYLASNPNRVYTRDQLLDEVWGFEYYGDSRTIDVHVKRLREKLEGVSDKWSLKTVWGVGYKFESEEDE